MILVSVSYKNTLYLVGILHRIREIGNYKVNAEHIGVGECKSAIDKYHIALTFIERHILADLVKAAEERDIYRYIVLLRSLFSFLILRGLSRVILALTLCFLSCFLLAVRISRIALFTLRRNCIRGFTLRFILRSFWLVFILF